AEEWACDASNATWMVDRLEERGLAERRSSPTDRRGKLVGLLARGPKPRGGPQPGVSRCRAVSLPEPRERARAKPFLTRVSSTPMASTADVLSQIERAFAGPPRPADTHLLHRDARAEH